MVNMKAIENGCGYLTNGFKKIKNDQLKSVLKVKKAGFHDQQDKRARYNNIHIMDQKDSSTHHDEVDHIIINYQKAQSRALNETAAVGFNTPETYQEAQNERFTGTADFTAISDGFSDLNIKYRIYNNYNNSSVASNYEMQPNQNNLGMSIKDKEIITKINTNDADAKRQTNYRFQKDLNLDLME